MELEEDRFKKLPLRARKNGQRIKTGAQRVVENMIRKDAKKARKASVPISLVADGGVKLETSPGIDYLKSERSNLNIEFPLSKKQQEALLAEEKFVLYGGAKGGGKSWFLCVWVFLMAIKNKGNKVFFCRRRSVDFTNTTLETWKKVIPAQLYRVNEQKKKIYIDASGSVIDFGGLDDPLLIQSLNSAEYAHIGIDQAEEIEQDSFSMLRGTLRHRLKDGSVPKYMIRLTANPAQCWLKEYFITFPEKDTRFIPALPTDNPGLPKDYVDNLAEAFKHKPQLLAAYLHGSWDDLTGHDICIASKDIERSRGKEAYGPVLKRIVVNDPSRFGDDENVMMVMEERLGGIELKETIGLSNLSTMETAGRLVALKRKWDAQAIAVDVIGLGSGIVDSLFEMKEPVIGISSSNKPNIETNEKKFVNLRAQMWIEAGRKFAEGRVCLPTQDHILSSQLGSIKFKFMSNGRMQVEAKDEIKKRLGRSPDRADCFVMGLHALDQVDNMEEMKYHEKTLDRQGFGQLVTEDTEYESGDFSGYNL